MAGFNGREITVDWDSTTIVGVRSKGIGMSNELVNVTTDDDNGWQTFLGKPGVKGVEHTIAGITQDEILIAEFFNANPTGETVAVNLPSLLASPGSFSGTNMLQNLELTGEHDGAYEFSATIVSSGAQTYTASSA